MKKRIIGILLSSLLCTAVLAGCGEKEEEDDTSSRRSGSSRNRHDDDDEEEDEDEIVDESDPGDTQDGSVVISEDGCIIVSDVEGLIASMAPGAHIVLEPGVYNISAYLQEQWDESGASYDTMTLFGNEDLWITQVYDGLQLDITRMDGLTIIGRSSDRSDTEIITEPRYANVFSFHNCDDVMLANLTLGHTETGECIGDVLWFEGCDDALLVNLDIYGCGCYGVSSCGGGGGFHLYDCTIRDCSYGPLSITNNGRGKDWIFARCELTGSRGSGYADVFEGAAMYFHDCVFGDAESAYYALRSDVITDGCEWGDFEIYPEYPSDEGPEFHRDRLEIAPFDEAVLKDTAWRWMIPMDEGDVTTMAIAEWLCFGADGSGEWDKPYAEPAFTWECDSQYSAVLYDEDGNEMGGITLYYDPEMEDIMFMYANLYNEDLWFYKE